VSSVSAVNHHSTPSPYSFITALCTAQQPWPDSPLPYLLSSQSEPSSLTPHLACYRGMKFEFYPTRSIFYFYSFYSSFRTWFNIVVNTSSKKSFCWPFSVYLIPRILPRNLHTTSKRSLVIMQDFIHEGTLV